ncbi:L-alanine-DL-glutamate epimerase-like enolase superfamily enzyme [Bradyrhizobium sp. GM0.4]
MKITRVRTHILEAKLSQPFAYSRAWYDTRTAMLVEIETDNGLVGWGECYGPARITAAVVQSIAPWLIGEDPLRTDVLWQMVYARLRDHGQKGVVIQGMSGIDIALWDIKGKHFGVPVHQLLGGGARKQVAAYATGLYRRKSGDPLELSGGGSGGLCRRRIPRREAEGRFRHRGGCRGHPRGARGDRPRCRADGRCEPRL